MKQLEGQVAVVTGAGRGIGQAIAQGLAAEGAAVVCAARTEEEIKETAVAIQQANGQAAHFPVDVTNFESTVALFDFAKGHFGAVDILFVNAGISTSQKSVEESDTAVWANVILTNLIGAYHTAKAAIPHLKARGGGKIIMVGSGLGHKGIPNRSAYASSKAGLWMLTRTLAQELAPHFIAVNELIPGPVKTGMTPGSQQETQELLGDGEWVKQPEDVVPLALFLATQPKTGPTAQSFSLMRRDG